MNTKTEIKSKSLIHYIKIMVLLLRHSKDVVYETVESQFSHILRNFIVVSRLYFITRKTHTI